jgi:hypothetical protein
MGFLNLFGSEDNSSSSSTSQTNNTTNTDESKMFGDNAVDGSGNSWLDFSNRSTNFADMSDRSTFFLDSSDRSTTFTDNSDRSYSGNSGSFNTTTFTDASSRTYTDYGSVGAALGAMGGMGGYAVTANGQSVGSALESVKMQAAINAAGVEQAFGLAEKVAASTEKTAAQIMGFAQTAANLPTNSSTQKAADAENKIKQMGLIALAVVAGLFILKRA